MINQQGGVPLTFVGKTYAIDVQVIDNEAEVTCTGFILTNR